MITHFIRSTICLCIISTFNNYAYCQKGFEGIITAEKNFAAYAVTNNTKEAFLKFIDSNAVHLDNAGNAVNGLTFWQKAEARKAKLNWQPTYSELSSSKDFGYTTGPWQLYTSSIIDTPVARGQFVTIWHIDKNNQWKFLLDLGMSYKLTAPSMPAGDVKTFQLKKTSNNNDADIMLAEKTFIKAFEQDVAAAYRMYLSTQSRLNRNGNVPATDKSSKQSYIDALPAHVSFLPLGFFMSNANDLGIVYGNTLLNGKKENYMHIWRKEKNAWKIALEVIRF